MLNLVARAPFPEIPGAVALGMDHLGAPGRNNAEPCLFTAALADLDRDQGKDVRPIAWRDALESCEIARADLADAFASKALVYWQGGERWTLKGRPVSLDRVCREFWPPFVAAVLADLDRSEEIAAAALARVRAGLRARHEDAAAKLEREHARYLRRISWPVPLAVFWICDRDFGGGLEWIADPERPNLAVYSDLRAQFDAMDAQIAIDLDESTPLEQLLRAAIAIPGLLLARIPDQMDYRPIDVRHIETGSFRFRGPLYDRARTGDVDFAGVCVDREKLWQAFPHPAVLCMEALRDWFQSAATVASAPGVRASKNRRGGRRPVERMAAAEALRVLWAEGEPPPKLRTLNLHLTRCKGAVREVSRETFNAAVELVGSERDGREKPLNEGLAE